MPQPVADLGAAGQAAGHPALSQAARDGAHDVPGRQLRPSRRRSIFVRAGRSPARCRCPAGRCRFCGRARRISAHDMYRPMALARWTALFDDKGLFVGRPQEAGRAVADRPVPRRARSACRRRASPRAMRSRTRPMPFPTTGWTGVASVSEGPSVESAVRFSKSASTSGSRSLSTPDATSVPTGPIPRRRIAV